MYTVDAVGLDDYVRGVIAAEMPSSWSPEALKTQAVAARTYAITTNVGGGFYDLYPDTRSQMYRGVSAETPATDAAVAATAGQVVTYNGTPAVTTIGSPDDANPSECATRAARLTASVME